MGVTEWGEWREAVAVAQLASTMGMLGAIWVVQLCVYPRFTDLDPEKFVVAHFKHCAGIGLVVVPLMVVELLSATFLVWVGGGGLMQWLALTLTLAAWISTGLIQAPQHRRLMAGYDAELCRSLTFRNWIRTVLWTAKSVVLLILTGQAIFVGL